MRAVVHHRAPCGDFLIYLVSDAGDGTRVALTPHVDDGAMPLVAWHREIVPPGGDLPVAFQVSEQGLARFLQDHAQQLLTGRP